MGDEHLLYIDTGVLFNLLTANIATIILQTIPYHCAVTYETAQTPLELLPKDDAQDDQHRLLEQRLGLFQQGLLEVHHLDVREYPSILVQVARSISAKHTSLLTLVAAHNATLASDDTKTRTVLRTLFPHIPIISTLSLLYHLHQHPSFSHDEFHIIKHHLNSRARFIPARDDPLFTWWQHL